MKRCAAIIPCDMGSNTVQDCLCSRHNVSGHKDGGSERYSAPFRHAGMTITAVNEVL